MEEGIADHAELFSSLGNETRLAIIDAFDDAIDYEPTTYAGLMEEVDVEDSGRFNYHLQELLDQFVQKDGSHYHLTPAGIVLVRAMRAGQYDRTFDDLGDVAVDSYCELCGSRRIIHHQGVAVVTCPNCLDGLCWNMMVPEAFERRDDDEIRDAVDTGLKATYRSMVEDVCPECSGPTEVRLSAETKLPIRIRSREYLVYYRCDVCSALTFSSVGQFLQIHPAVVEYCHEHDVDFPDQRLWANSSAITDATTHVRSRDPWEVVKYVDVDGFRLVAVVEGDGTVRHVDHVQIGDSNGESARYPEESFEA